MIQFERRESPTIPTQDLRERTCRSHRAGQVALGPPGAGRFPLQDHRTVIHRAATHRAFRPI